MRFLILAAALAFTASPALGQFRQELPQWAEQGNVSVQSRLGLMYDLDWHVPQNDAEGVRWKPILIGAGIGLTAGFGIGWVKDTPIGFPFGHPELECILPSPGDPDYPGPCGERDRPYQFRITGSLVGIGAGAALGWVWTLGKRPLEGAP